MDLELIYIFTSIAIILLCCAHKGALNLEGFATKCFSCEKQQPFVAHGSKCFDCENQIPRFRRPSKRASGLIPPYVV